MILQTRNQKGKALPCIFECCSWWVPNGTKPNAYSETLWNKIHIQTNLFWGVKSCVWILFLKSKTTYFKLLSSCHLKRLKCNDGNTHGTNWVKLATKCTLCQGALCRYTYIHIHPTKGLKPYFNPLPSLTLQSAQDLNVPCRPKCSKALLLSYTFKCLLKKTQSFCPCSRALNRSGKGFNQLYHLFKYDALELHHNNMCWGHVVAQWLRHCATNWKVAGLIPDGVTGIFNCRNPSGRTMALGSTRPLTEMSTRNIISWG
jgi:hypothetical protein